MRQKALDHPDMGTHQDVTPLQAIGKANKS